MAVRLASQRYEMQKTAIYARQVAGRGSWTEKQTARLRGGSTDAALVTVEDVDQLLDESDAEA